ncbi:hypothetical protein L873DRAFT_1793046 [Choiromyces venosus 120613-1]|uniref:Uncharacterized protein n=1 Tax=Choiromyces venosus 120613-1 TaxID=1336337 RepID=A0A3N4J7U3_9PEZI|nr:hypothetical protein L873DRAFT_1793046 [Choiromyces venosus 120613-1]
MQLTYYPPLLLPSLGALAAPNPPTPTTSANLPNRDYNPEHHTRRHTHSQHPAPTSNNKPTPIKHLQTSPKPNPAKTPPEIPRRGRHQRFPDRNLRAAHLRQPQKHGRADFIQVLSVSAVILAPAGRAGQGCEGLCAARGGARE